MSYSVDLTSREAIQAIQFEIWPDCNNGCEYCYLKGTRRVTSLQEKKSNLIDTAKTILNPKIMENYNAVGLIGGEIFSGQLVGCEDEWGSLLKTVKFLFQRNQIKEFWIATSLLYKDLCWLEQSLKVLNIANLGSNHCVRICTSYDTIGRFHNPEEEELWLSNIKYLKEEYPNVLIHTQTILAQDTINKLLEDNEYFNFVLKYSSIDFRYPSISRADCPTVTGIKDYRSKMLERVRDFPKGFFIEDRNKFIKFLRIFYKQFGLQKVQNLIHQPEMRSRRLKIYVDNAEIEDRWNDTRDVYLPCGHLVDGLCYVNDSEHCIYCDIEKFIKSLETLN